MALSQALVEAELQSRFRTALGTFTSADDLARLRFAYLDALRIIWYKKEWRFRNKTATLITTTAGGKGPFPAPDGLYKLAQSLDIYRFGFDAAQILAPIKDTTSTSYFLWIDVETGDLFFVSAPGDATLTLNFQAEFDNDPANIAATIELFPGSVMAPLYSLTKANLYKDLPQFAALAEGARQEANQEIEDLWQDYSAGQARQRQMAPRALHGGTLDGMADPIPLRGPQRWYRRY